MPDLRLSAIVFVAGLAAAGACASPARERAMQFTGAELPLERAIAADDAAAVEAAIAAGARVDARGEHGVTPLEYAVGLAHRAAAGALIRRHADPNLRDAEGDSAMSLAVRQYAKDPALLAAGGDPNIARYDGDPVIAYLVAAHDLDGIAYLHAHGADLDREINGQPMVVDAAISVDWDVVWRLIELGARTDTPKVRDGMLFAFKKPEITPPDHPLYAAKVKVWQHLHAQGLHPEAPIGMPG